MDKPIEKATDIKSCLSVHSTNIVGKQEKNSELLK